jgi:hypothetical protein
MSEPVMCSLTPAAMPSGRAGLLPGLVEQSITRDALADGYRLTFAASSARILQIARVIDAERQCCRWLRFGLDVPPGGEAVTLTLSGPPGATEFLTALFES